jgi:hypothetical protein
MNVRLKPRTPFLTVEIDISWDVAELIVDAGPGLIKAVAMALKNRKSELAAAHDGQTRLDDQLAANRSDWSALAIRCEAEVARRANGPGQRPAIIRQLAAELKMSRPDLERIIRVYRRERLEGERKRRTVQVIRRHLQGRTHRAIAAELGLQTVAKTLAVSSDLLGRLRAAEAGSAVDGGAQP